MVVYWSWSDFEISTITSAYVAVYYKYMNNLW